mmetsp:Transcript_34917/g.90465  ORF Transcript_34917/g.90465 Transcript_34917/m.90465 type:complete len:325 (-) Transcript_34917:569-1543(-)|eukprot:CAMPEP_0113886322 /NCGR_PEP_ID=MMETSP0780_2-20120614/11476_1 /TAXON_ID=652834 /ORGANISM="Palpitomonas bilix" /LENGTH=324 /DNA_ID=CAMNT_0000874495 /DNA_START=77 /DNA_END=1051 /DNA_ORIENTATION=+ /assembly_acc=CAM_ASM_000599
MALRHLVRSLASFSVGPTFGRRAASSSVSTLLRGGDDADAIASLIREYTDGSVDTRRFLRRLVEYDDWRAISAGEVKSESLKLIALTNRRGEDEAVFWTKDENMKVMEDDIRVILGLSTDERFPSLVVPGFIAFHNIHAAGKAGSQLGRLQIDPGTPHNFAIEGEFLPLVSKWADIVAFERGLHFHLSQSGGGNGQPAVSTTPFSLIDRDVFLLTEGPEHFTVPDSVLSSSLLFGKGGFSVNNMGNPDHALVFTSPELLEDFEAKLEVNGMKGRYAVHLLPLKRAIEELFSKGDLQCSALAVNPCDTLREMVISRKVGLSWLKP